MPALPAIAVVYDDSDEGFRPEDSLYFAALAGETMVWLHACGLTGPRLLWPEGSQPSMPLSQWKRFYSETIRKRVQAARERQLERFKGTKLTCNAEMGPTEVGEFCKTDASGEKLLKAAVQQLHLSARAYHRVLKLARTIADLAASDNIAANHVAEAVQYRPRVGM